MVHADPCGQAIDTIHHWLGWAPSVHQPIVESFSPFSVPGQLGVFRMTACFIHTCRISVFHVTKKTFFETLLQYLAKKVVHNNHSLLTREISLDTCLDPETSSPRGWLDLFLTCGQKKRNKWISKIWIPHNQSYQKCLWSMFRQIFFCPSCVCTTSNYLAEEASRIGLYDEVSLKWSAMIEYPETQQRILPITRWQFFVRCH